ncbi:DUF4365 domain-containing protein [Vibrio alginolyticus]|uniref:DUF4365 domain-containing protein n=1 Tax=Vibrio alginolyticus TaxID=663 RepID=UPI00148E557F|nr:DUF4365 domain-containing protein [Vibrio alginolyticus]NOH89174.1 DUF4365 domain-containing protein [Vibrio alginolyticus]HCZ9714708.1 DUF4365 domain-containing protein [Vibrio parahaemolyticus]
MSKERGLGGTAVSHSKELLSLAYIESLIAVSGLNSLKPEIDNNGIDIVISGKDFTDGFIDDPHMSAQLKCVQKSALRLDLETRELVYQCPAKNYNKLVTRGMLPKILVVHMAPNTQSEWMYSNKVGLTLSYASYWVCLADRPQTNQQSISVRIPLSQQLTSKSLIWMMKKISKGEDIFNCEGGYDE